jgi:F0F1-type ATP synthase delta subunit
MYRKTFIQIIFGEKKEVSVQIMLEEKWQSLTIFKCFENVRKHHMHIFNVSITTAHSLKNVSLMVWELIAQSR